MKDLIKSQNEEHMRIHLKCLARSGCAKDCGENTVILMGYAVSIIEEEISKAKKETAKMICDKMIEEIEKIKNIEMFGKNFDYDNGFNDGLNEVESKIEQQILKELL